jgi:outer membrane murein-binding lipoprotein Lpp
MRGTPWPGRRSRVPRGLALAAAITGAALVAGCGADAGGPSKQTYISDANRICSDGNRAIKPLADRVDTAQRGADPDQVFRELAVLTRKASDASQPHLDRLDALKTPGGDRDALKGWIADQRRQQSLLAELGDALEERDDATISTLSQRIATLNTKNDAFAKKYGLAECARNVG